MKKILIFALCVAFTLQTAGMVSAKVIYMPDVTEEMSSPYYWTDKQANSDKQLATSDEIYALNVAFLLADDTKMYDLKNMSDTVNGVTLSEELYNGAKADAEYYVNAGTCDADGNPITMEYFEDVLENCKNPNATEEQPVQYAVAVNRTNLLVFPTDKVIQDDADDPDFDNQFNSALRVNEPVMVLSVSADEKYYCVYASHCPGWVPAEDVAICEDKEEWLDAWDIEDEDVLVVYDDRIFTEKSNADPAVSRRELSMGTVLKQASDEEIAAASGISNRAGYNNHVVWMPVRNEDGSYGKTLALISESAKVSEGYLPLTRENIAMVAFNSLGDEYGWGGMLSSEDCSGYVRGIYKCFGFEMPRNTTWQKAMPVKGFDISEYTDEQKMELLDTLPLGAVLFFSGHEMMYLGHEDGKYYVISSTSSIMNPDESGKQRARSIMINTLDVKRANGNTWLSSLNYATIPYYDPEHELEDISIHEDTDTSVTETPGDADTGSEITPVTVKMDIAVKLGKRKITINTAKGCKIVVKASKKIFTKNGKKTKTYTIKSSSKKNVIKLNTKLKSGMSLKITVSNTEYVSTQVVSV